VNRTRVSLGCAGLAAVLIAALPACGRLAASGAGAPESREFFVVTNEVQWQARPGEAAVVDRNRGPVREIDRYTFEPGFLVVAEGDRVVLRIHGIKGGKHVVEVPAFKTGEVPILRGQERTISFVADRPGTFLIRCTIHEGSGEEGPMVGYLHVLRK
jgi:plastocyanin